MPESLIRRAPVNIAEAAPDYNRERPESTIVLPRVAGFFLMIAAEHLGTPVMVDTDDKIAPKYKAMYPSVMRSLEAQYGADAASEARDLALEIIPHYGLGSFERVLNDYIGPNSEQLARIETASALKGNVRSFVNSLDVIDSLEPRLKRDVNSIDAIDDLDR